MHTGAGHYGEVCLVERISDSGRFALKTIVKRKPIYVEILKNEVQILSVSPAGGLNGVAVLGSRMFRPSQRRLGLHVVLAEH